MDLHDRWVWMDECSRVRDFHYFGRDSRHTMMRNWSNTHTKLLVVVMIGVRSKTTDSIWVCAQIFQNTLKTENTWKKSNFPIWNPYFCMLIKTFDHKYVFLPDKFPHFADLNLLIFLFIWLRWLGEKSKKYKIK